MCTQFMSQIVICTPPYRGFISENSQLHFAFKSRLDFCEAQLNQDSLLGIISRHEVTFAPNSHIVVPCWLEKGTKSLLFCYFCFTGYRYQLLCWSSLIQHRVNVWVHGVLFQLLLYLLRHFRLIGDIYNSKSRDNLANLTITAILLAIINFTNKYRPEQWSVV